VAVTLSHFSAENPQVAYSYTMKTPLMLTGSLAVGLALGMIIPSLTTGSTSPSPVVSFQAVPVGGYVIILKTSTGEVVRVVHVQDLRKEMEK
jgi:hypothetical protein